MEKIIFIMPTAIPVEAKYMNYAIVYLGAILAFAGAYWFLGARKFYTGPLIEAEVQLDSNSDDVQIPRSKETDGSDHSGQYV